MKEKNIVGKNVLGSEIRQWSSTGCNRLTTGCNRLTTGWHRLPWCISGSSSELRWSWALIFYSFVVLSSTWKLPSMGFQLPLSWEIEFLCTGCNRLPDWVWFQNFPHPESQSSSENFYSVFFSHHVHPLNFDIKKDLAQSDCLKESGTHTNTLRPNTPPQPSFLRNRLHMSLSTEWEWSES